MQAKISLISNQQFPQKQTRKFKTIAKESIVLRANSVVFLSW